MKSQIKHKSPKKAVKTMAAVAKPLSALAAKASATIHKIGHRPTGPGKTFHKDGHWIENPRKNTVLTCTCGNRYLKTRHNQTRCLTCISQGR
jgi:hypothetical protein